MSTVQSSTFVITREDRGEDPKTIVSQGLRIGRFPDSDILLNHPTVSRLHSGINEIDGFFYLINLSGSSATTLNDRVIAFNEAEALSVGDIIQIGPFFLHIQQTRERLRIRVEQQIAHNVGQGSTHDLVVGRQIVAAQKPAIDPAEAASSLKVFWAKRTREKAGRPSPLHPKRQPTLGRARFNWTPTRDLVRPWPFSIFVWGAIVIGVLTVAGAIGYKNAFVPQPVSAAHSSSQMALSPAIAKTTNGNSCTSCHSIGIGLSNAETMSANCADCHKTDAMSPTISHAHREAGITCIGCHPEHRGVGAKPIAFALAACASCHNDSNHEKYNGKSVHTPHGGTFGYPVVNGKWVWKGLDAEELAEKPEVEALFKQSALKPGQEQQRLSAQFHGIHLYRVKAVEGITRGNQPTLAPDALSCSSCHKTGYAGTNLDRTSPRLTCAACHDGQGEAAMQGTPPGVTGAICVSCHVQHARDIPWTASLAGSRQTLERK